MSAAKGPTFRIRQNRWDNWYGYKGARRVIMFMNSRSETQEQEAKRWLAERKAGGPAWPHERTFRPR